MTEGRPVLLLVLAFCCGILLTTLGARLGASASPQNDRLRSILCGVLFLVLAFGKLI